MRVGVHVLCFNVDRFLPHVIENCYPHVDKVYLAWSPVSWGYGSSRRENPTDIYKYDIAARFPKCEIVEGVWDTEEDMRNACLERARADGCDWLVIQDADEFYSDASWVLALRSLAIAPSSLNLVKTTWYNFWKHPSIIAVNRHGGYKTNNAGFALRVAGDAHFVNKRLTNYSDHTRSVILDAPCYHYGWTLSDEEMKIKLSTWGHANDFDVRRWYELKWRGWSFETRDIYPLSPRTWSRAVFFPGEHQMFAVDIFGSDFFMNEFAVDNTLSMNGFVKQCLYDSRARVSDVRAQLARFRRHVNL